MIVVDLETSGVDYVDTGIFQIGAIDFENPENEFFGECRVDDEDRVTEESLFVIGKTEQELRDKSKQSQKELLEKFFEWCEKIKIKNMIAQGPQFEIGFLRVKAQKYNLKYPFHHRAFDLHTFAQARHREIKGKFLIGADKSTMDLTNILGFCGIPDERTKHNALEDSKLTAECFSRLFFGKGIFEEFKRFPVPEYLERNGGKDE